MNTSAGGGGNSNSINSNMKHSRIGVYLSEKTRAVASGTVAAYKPEDKGNCDRALEFYNFLINELKNYVDVSFVVVPSFDVKSTSFLESVANNTASFIGKQAPYKKNTTDFNKENEISLSETFCFNEETKMNTNFLNQKLLGELTLTGLININGVETVWWVSILQFKIDEYDKYCLYIKAFCKNNDILINSSRIGLDIILDLCEKFNNSRKSFKMTYSYLDPLMMAITWWKLCGFQVKHPGYLFNTKPNRMERKFQQVLSSSSASFSVEAISSLKSPSTEIGSDESRDKASDEEERLLFEKLQQMPAAVAKEYKDTRKLGPNENWDDSDYEYENDDEEEYDEEDNEKQGVSIVLEDDDDGNQEPYRKKSRIGKNSSNGGSKKNKRRKTNKKKTNKNKKKTNRKVKRSRRRTRRF